MPYTAFHIYILFGIDPFDSIYSRLINYFSISFCNFSPHRHIDGNHMGRWWMVFHGCVDGFSRG